MNTYVLDSKPQTGRFSHLFMKVVLITVALLIGAVAGLWVAVRTIPLPPQVEYYYLTK